MATQSSFFPSIIAGALAGALVSLLILQSPAALERGESSSNRSSSDPVTVTPSEDATAYERAIIAAVEAAQPAVVSIVITKDVPVFEEFLQDVDPFSDFFGSPFSFQIPRLRERGTERQEVGGGSGFLVSADGTVVTNRHVVSDEEAEYTVFLTDGTKYDASVVARDPVNDIAILDIDAANLPHLEFADSSAIQVGQSAIAIGNALGEFSNTVSAGVVSGLARSIQAASQLGQIEQLDEVIQTDAAINPGNSGGPLLDLHGRVIGVNVAVALGSENIGFALPANTVQSVVDSVRETGRIVRPYLGVRYTPITPAIAQANNLSVDYGVLIVGDASQGHLGVVQGSPADRAGLREGAVILEIDGERLDEDTSLASVIRNKSVGQTVQLRVLSGGEERSVSVELVEFPT